MDIRNVVERGKTRTSWKSLEQVLQYFDEAEVVEMVARFIDGRVSHQKSMAKRNERMKMAMAVYKRLEAEGIGGTRVNLSEDEDGGEE